jgi:hypothetical protein
MWSKDVVDWIEGNTASFKIWFLYFSRNSLDVGTNKKEMKGRLIDERKIG